MHQGSFLSRLSRVLLAMGFLGVLLVQGAVAQATSTWECLPEETVIALRIPDGQAIAEAIVRDTKFGAVMFSDQRKAAVAKVLESDRAAQWSMFLERLKDYGLTTDDLVGLLTGESGYAVVMAPATGTVEEKPEFAGLGWFEPGEELAAKLVEATAKLIDEQDKEHPIKRIDLTLADSPVMQLHMPSLEVEHEADFDVGDEYGDLSEAEQREVWQKAYQEWKESAVEKVVYHTMLISRHEGKLLIAHNYQAEDEEAAAVTAEQLSAVFGRLLAAHAAEDEGFASRLADGAGVARVMALEGLPVFEVLGDVAPLVKLMRASAPSVKRAEQGINILGLDSLGPFAMRSTMQGMRWQTDISISATAPRQGLMQLLDQEPLAVDPPQWVPADAVRYTQWSFDLGKAYEMFKEEAMCEFPDQAGPGFTMAETQVQNFVKASLSEVLSSLGNRHVMMSFGLESGEAAEDNDDSEDEDTNSASERLAFVWQVDDEELWVRLLKAIAPFAGMAPGTESAEEQGFSGWRMKRGTNEGGLFLGKGYLVLGIGSGVVESVLSSLNNPPTGSDALRGSEVFDAASEMIDLEPAMVVEITDGGRYMSQQLDVAREMLEGFDESEYDTATQLAISLARAIMPSRDEMDGLLGVSVSRAAVNENGVFIQSVQEMPAP